MMELGCRAWLLYVLDYLSNCKKQIRVIVSHNREVRKTLKIAKYHYYAIMYSYILGFALSYVISAPLTASSSAKPTLQLIPPASVLFEGLNLQKKIPFTSETLTESY